MTTPWYPEAGLPAGQVEIQATADDLVFTVRDQHGTPLATGRLPLAWPLTSEGSRWNAQLFPPPDTFGRLELRT